LTKFLFDWILMGTEFLLIVFAVSSGFVRNARRFTGWVRSLRSRKEWSCKGMGCGYELGSGLLDGRTETDRGGRIRITANSQSYRGQYKHDESESCGRASERMSDCARLSFPFLFLTSSAMCKKQVGSSKDCFVLNDKEVHTCTRRCRSNSVVI
jgi:hypothetical protein